MEDAVAKSIHDRLDRQAKSLEMLTESMDSMRKTVERIAVQDEQIKHLQGETSALWAKMDRLTANDGIITNMQQFQASCPRRHIWAMWLVVLPMGLALLKFVFSDGCF
jgi:methyl-accepting chemotaxis protein